MVMTYPKAQVLQLMQRLGLQDNLARAHRELPDVVDAERDAALLNQLGISSSRDELMNDLGGSP